MPKVDGDIVLTAGLDASDVMDTSDHLKQDIERIFKSAEGKHTSTAFKSLQMSMDQAITKSDEIIQKMEAVAAQRFDAQNFVNLNNELMQVNNQIEQVTEKLANVRGNFALSGRSRTALIKQYEAELASLQNQYDQLTQQIDSFGGLNQDAQGAITRYQEISEELGEIETRIQNIQTEAQAIDGRRIDTANYAQLKNELAAIKQEAAEVEARLKSFGDPQFANSKKRRDIQRYTITLDALNRIIEDIKFNMKLMEDTGTDTTFSEADKQRIRELTTDYDNCIQSMQQLKAEREQLPTAFTGVDTDEYQQLTNQLNSVNNRMVVLRQRAFESGNATSHATKNAKSLESITKKLTKTLSSLASIAKKAINNVGKLGSVFFSLGKKNDNLEKSFKRSIKTLIKYGFGVRSFFFLYRRIRKAIVEGFETLAQVHQPFNAAMSSMKTSLDLLKNTLAASFAPIIETVAPIITKFLNMMADAVASVGQFIAALTGKEYVRAAAVAVDYAESVQQGANSSKNATDATKEQTKAAKELKRQLAGFDDVEILHEDKDTDTTTTDTTTDPSTIFSSMPIDNAISEFAKRFKAAWANLDLTDIGRKLGEKLLNALQNIPWDSIKTALSNTATRIATFLNGFLSVPGLFTEIGKTLAEALNSAFTFLNAFVTKFNWASLGKAVKEGILGFLTNIDWNLIYNTASELGKGLGTALENAIDNPQVWKEIFGFFSKRFNAFLYVVAGFVTSVNWGSVAHNIAVGLNDAINDIDWETFANTLSFLLDSAFDALYNFVATFDFENLATKIADSISTVLERTNWSQFGLALGLAVMKLFLFLETLFERVNWGALARAIVSAIGTFFETLSWSDIGRAFGRAIIALFTFLSALFDAINWGALGDYIVQGIKDFFEGVQWTEVTEALAEFLAKALKAFFIDKNLLIWKLRIELGKWIVTGIKDGITGETESGSFVDWISEHVTQPMRKGLGLSVNKEETNLNEIGAEITTDVKDGAADEAADSDVWANMFVAEPMSKEVSDAFGITNGGSSVFADIGSSLMSGMQSGVVNNQQVATQAVEGAQNDMLGVFSGFTQWTNTGGKLVSDGLILGMAFQFPSLITAMTNVDALMRGTIESNLSKWSDTGASIIDNIIEGISTASSNIGTIANTLASSVNSAFAYMDWSGLGWNIGMGIYNGLSNAGGYLDTLAWNTAINMYNSACSALGIASPSKKFAWVGEMMTEGLRNGIVDNAANATTAVTDMVSDMTDAASSNNPEISINTAVNSWINDLDEVLTQFADTVTDKFDSLINTLNGLNTSYAVPAISAGHVIPSYASTSHTEVDDRLNKVIDNLDYLSAQIVTRTELSDIITTVVQRYLNIDFYIGDEQLARHANAGNVKLQRRYSPTK